MKKNLEGAGAAGITWMMILILLFLTVNSFLFRCYIDTTYVEYIHYRTDNWLLAAVFLLAAGYGIYFCMEKKIFAKIPEKPLLWILLLFVTVLSGVWIFASHSFPGADQETILNCAEAMIQEYYGYMATGGYLQTNPHQAGMVAFYEWFSRIFTGGNVNYHAICGFNVLMIDGIFLELYLITRRLTEEKEAVILELLLSFGCLQLMLYSPFAYGLIPGLFFALAGIHFLLRLVQEKHWQDGLLMALMLSISVVFKSNYQIFVIAAAVILVGKAVSEKKIFYIFLILLTLVGFTGINGAIRKNYEARSGMEFAQSIPSTAYIAMGMQEGHMASGWYNEYNRLVFYDNECNEAEADRIARADIRARLAEFAKEPLEALKFYYRKIVSQWNEVTYESIWITSNLGYFPKDLSKTVQSIYTGKLHSLIEAFMNLYQLLLFAGALLYAWTMKKNRDLSKTILLLCILGGFLFHILWEGKSQYIISYFPLMIPCAAMGLTKLKGTQR